MARFFCIFLSLSFLSCGFDPDPFRESARKDVYDYEFKEEISGCTTGYHSFTEVATFCDALLDDALNQNCAVGKRREYHSLRC